MGYLQGENTLDFVKEVHTIRFFIYIYVSQKTVWNNRNKALVIQHRRREVKKMAKSLIESLQLISISQLSPQNICLVI